MNLTADAVTRFLRLDKLTFRKIHILVAVLTILSVIFLTLIKIHVIAPTRRENPAWERISETPQFLVLYNVLIAIGFWIIYATRDKTKYYSLRAYIYGMLLGGVAGELLHLFAKHLLRT
jgi:hypothetical protein